MTTSQIALARTHASRDLSRRLPYYLIAEEAHQMIGAAADELDQLSLGVLWETGVRVSEVIQHQAASSNNVAPCNLILNQGLPGPEPRMPPRSLVDGHSFRIWGASRLRCDQGSLGTMGSSGIRKPVAS